MIKITQKHDTAICQMPAVHFAPVAFDNNQGWVRTN